MVDPRQADFDRWVQLADTDPDAFEERRQRVIDAAIEDAPAVHRERLRRLQWRIEQERRRSPNAIASCMNLSRMMWEKVVGENGLLDALNGTLPDDGGKERARILPLRTHE